MAVHRCHFLSDALCCNDQILFQNDPEALEAKGEIAFDDDARVAHSCC